MTAENYKSIAQEEIFGPVFGIMTVNNEDEVLNQYLETKTIWISHS